VAAIFVIINLPSTKQWAADQALQIVNRDFKAQMSTESVEVNFFGDVTIKGLKVKDYKGLILFSQRIYCQFQLAFFASNISKSNSLSFNSLTLKMPM
jgi:hypothetical protein